MSFSPAHALDDEVKHHPHDVRMVRPETPLFLTGGLGLESEESPGGRPARHDGPVATGPRSSPALWAGCKPPKEPLATCDKRCRRMGVEKQQFCCGVDLVWIVVEFLS